MALPVLVALVLLFSTCGQGMLIYPTMFEHQRLATRINCQIQEPQHFHYSSVTELWGDMGGQILLDADVVLHCLGDDKGGKYESEALKYRVELYELRITEKRPSDKASLTRPKRGVGDFFTNQWRKVKNFFKRVFGQKGKQPEVTEAIDKDDERKDAADTPDEEEDINQEDYVSLYSTPFLFVQLANGSIPEIRFSENEKDSRVKNFKRHLVDSFSTQLNFNLKGKATVEKSVLGEHTSTYNITVNEDSPVLNVAGLSFLKQREPTVVVSKVVTGNDILRLAPSEALNDRQKMDLLVQQKQVYQNGRLISSSGTSSIVLLHNSDSTPSRIRRDVEEDVTSYIQAQSTFDIQLQKRSKRSSFLNMRMGRGENEAYFPASRFAEIEENSEKADIQQFQKSIENIETFLESLSTGKDVEYDEKFQMLLMLVEQEVKLDLDKEQNSISSAVKRFLSKERMLVLCSRNSSVCRDFLQLLTLTGGSESEEVLLYFLSWKESNIDTRAVADVISDTSKPSPSFLRSLCRIVEDGSLDPETIGALSLSLGHLGSKANIEEQKAISKILTDLLKEKKNSWSSDPFIIDALEAVGNLKDDDTVPTVLTVSEHCMQSEAVQIACAHALRHSIHLPEVQVWIRNITNEGNCSVLREVVGSMMDKIQDQEMTPDITTWPRCDFNDIDTLLKAHLMSSECCSEDILLYFNRKQNSEANEIAQNFFGPESEPWNPRSNTRQKRSAWDELNCQEWTEDNHYRPIQDREEFAADRAMFNRRKSCLAFKRFGMKKANAEIYAGMFAGVKEPSNPLQYKLFTKFVSGLNFLGHQMEIGSFHFYHHSGKTKAYVRIMGRTRQEFSHDGCTPYDIKYRPLKHIPLYLVSIGPVQLSFGIHLSSQLGLDTACPEEMDVFELQPYTDVRVAGEAMGTVAFVRGAVNLGGNFNYKLQFTFTPSPNMCITGSHGHDPMSISFETYFQLFNSVLDRWGKHRVWRPGFLSWDVVRGNMKQWFNDTCIGTKNSDGSFLSGREIE